MQKGAIFPLFYLPPVAYFSQLLVNKDNIFVENMEHFEKQSFRNRATIHSPNGRLDLIVPVVRGSKNHTTVKDVKISYDFKWQRLHILSLQTSYRSSAYFEFYEDELMPFYEKNWEFLFDFNEQLLHSLFRFLKMDVKYDYTNAFEKVYMDKSDFRKSITPKHENPAAVKPYFQVFEERNGFLPNLSIVDLLFNQGPQSKNYL